MIDEFWVDVEGFPNYSVSNYGRVTNNQRGRDLKPYSDSKGYMKVSLYNNGVKTVMYVHTLVAKAFFLNYKEGVEVLHTNGVKDDNTVLNLTLGGRARRRKQ